MSTKKKIEAGTALDAVAKPRRMMGNPSCPRDSQHGVEHDETEGCCSPLPACQPVDPAPARPPADTGRGLYRKFIVERTDGSSASGGKHEHCRYFVLDLDHDRHAPAAIRAYADSCRSEYPALAADLDRACPPAPAAAPAPPGSMPTASAEELYNALRESLKLQRHYAELLNMNDGGQRRLDVFASPEAWIARLRETGDLPNKEVPRD